MWIYLLVYLSIPIWNRVFKKNRIAFITVVATELFLILALRAPTLGVDLDNYSGGYRYISSLSFADMIKSKDISIFLLGNFRRMPMERFDRSFGAC